MSSAKVNCRFHALYRDDNQFDTEGTSAVDGSSLLAGTISLLSSLGDRAPFSIFSTHFHQVAGLVDSCPGPRYLHMRTELTSTDLLYYFQLAEGTCSFSHAAAVARRAGMEEAVLERASVVLDCLSSNKQLGHGFGINQTEVNNCINQLLVLNVEDNDQIVDFMDKIRNIVM